MPRNIEHYLPPDLNVRAVYSAASEQIDWGLLLLRTPDAWKLTEGEGAIVGVCDTGIFPHRDLGDALIAEDDFISRPRRKNPIDQNGHGTHVAGIFGARRNDDGTVGVAPKCKIVNARCLDERGIGSGGAIADAIDFCREKGAGVINISIGSAGPDELIARAIERATAARVWCVCAAGNSGPGFGLDFPARWKGKPNPLRDCLAIGAFNRSGEPTSFSSQGPELDFSGPGQDILSLWLNDQYALLDGTSMATPFYSGLLALLVSRHKRLGAIKTPLDSYAAIRGHLRAYASDRGEPGPDIAWGWGPVSPADAVAGIVASDPAPTNPTPPAVDRQTIRVGRYLISTPALPSDQLTLGVNPAPPL